MSILPLEKIHQALHQGERPLEPVRDYTGEFVVEVAIGEKISRILKKLGY